MWSTRKPNQSAPAATDRSTRTWTHETVAQVYAETAREVPSTAKRRLEIYLSPGEDVVGKAGAFTTAARDAAEERAVAVPPLAAVKGRAAAAVLPEAAADAG